MHINDLFLKEWEIKSKHLLIFSMMLGLCKEVSPQREKLIYSIFNKSYERYSYKAVKIKKLKYI